MSSPATEWGTLRVRVPATSANLGPGFDMLGLALDCYTEYNFDFLSESRCDLRDPNGPVSIPTDKNLIWQSYRHFLELAGMPPGEIPGLSVLFRSELPFGRGFGSSASALVAGFGAARRVLKHEGRPVPNQTEAVRILTELEGHPDNVVPALLGGFSFSFIRDDRSVGTVFRQLPADLGLAIVIPDFTISTKSSRALLPGAVAMNDCLSNMRGILLWEEYLHTGEVSLLTEALRSDRLHEPYRAAMIPAYARLQEHCAQLGIYGVTISGSGPGLLAYYPAADQQQVITALQQFIQTGAHGIIRSCRPDYEGLTAVSEK
ncbi:MAG: homoserine kinase [Leptospiraceae bacterium]|nr:homoserine kinase [Leptospiraceae bacterium]MCB1315819.1 homoserine kinase [Leptospiraceae bacterium]